MGYLSGHLIENGGYSGKYHHARYGTGTGLNYMDARAERHGESMTAYSKTKQIKWAYPLVAAVLFLFIGGVYLVMHFNLVGHCPNRDIATSTLASGGQLKRVCSQLWSNIRLCDDC